MSLFRNYSPSADCCFCASMKRSLINIQNDLLLCWFFCFSYKLECVSIFSALPIIIFCHSTIDLSSISHWIFFLIPMTDCHKFIFHLHLDLTFGSCTYCNHFTMASSLFNSVHSIFRKIYTYPKRKPQMRAQFNFNDVQIRAQVSVCGEVQVACCADVHLLIFH